MRGFVGRVASGAQLITAALMAVVALRFAFVTFTAIMGASIETLPVDAASLPGASASVSFAPRAAPEPNSRAVSTPRGPSPSRRVMLMISVGDDRAEVYVNGQLLGRSPYVGDFSCKPGEPLRIEVVPEKRVIKRFTRTCQGDAVRIDE